MCATLLSLPRTSNSADLHAQAPSAKVEFPDSPHPKKCLSYCSKVC